LRDPLVGRALTLLHARPMHAWTLEELASEAAASRSALADRFTQIVGCPPIQYLTQWRMQIAAKRLAEPGVKIAAVAHEVGYESEAAFSRAFKKLVGRSPSQWRTSDLGSTAKAAHSVSWAGANARPEVCSKHSFVHPAVRDTSLTRRGLLPPDADEVRTECRSAPGD
jgi:AraC-like DNA-binding protein